MSHQSRQRVALICGGSRGIGLGVAKGLAGDGMRVAVAARTRSELDRAVACLGHGATGHAVDLADARQAEPLIKAIHRRHGRLDVLVCCQGTYPGARSFLEISPETFADVLATNLLGVFACAQAAGRLMLAQGDGGRIILISSMNALLAQEGAADYDATKAALHAAMRAMALELAPHAITVNAIAPGWIRTSMSAAELEELEVRSLNPRGRVGEPDDIARAVEWLAAPGNDYVTGSVVVIDGGQTAMLAPPGSIASPD